MTDLSDWEDFSRMDIKAEAGLLIIRLIARNKFGEEWSISEASIPLRSLTPEQRTDD